jgi:hypothetical protein
MENWDLSIGSVGGDGTQLDSNCSHFGKQKENSIKRVIRVNPNRLENGFYMANSKLNYQKSFSR